MSCCNSFLLFEAGKAMKEIIYAGGTHDNGSISAADKLLYGLAVKRGSN